MSEITYRFYIGLFSLMIALCMPVAYVSSIAGGHSISFEHFFTVFAFCMVNFTGCLMWESNQHVG